MNNENKAPVRQIKFRGLRVDGKGWVYGFYIERHGISEILQPSGTTPVIPETVGQFTGLLDKNGKEIYEGDRVKHGNNIFIVRHSNNRHVLVLKKENDTGMNWRDLECLGRVRKYVTVLGNIHQGSEVTNG